ncbi:MAG: ABC transporter ATP-binding protein [Bacteroidia bacterium]
MSTVIKVENIGKKYVLRHEQAERYKTFAGVLTNIMKVSEKSTSEEFWALNDVSFDVQQGDRVGIIGRNGAGKSTLLKVLSRIVTPTKGRIEINGRVSSLLEVGTGFHPELSGRENIYLNGSILGMNTKEIDRKFDEIVAFAEVEKFLDTPVKRYSSGMYVRLAFAVAAHLEPEILIIDEVLAVGDSKFQKKCIGKMEEVSESGKTLLFVSHNMGIVKQLCNKGVYLKNGTVAMVGPSGDVVNTYLKEGMSDSGEINRGNFNGPLNGTISFESLLVNGKSTGLNFDPKEPIEIKVSGNCKSDLSRTRITLSVYKNEERVFTLFDTKEPENLNKGSFESTFTVPPFVLRPNEYTIAVGAFMEGSGEWVYGQNLLLFNILDEYYPNYDFHAHGLFNLDVVGKRKN